MDDLVSFVDTILSGPAHLTGGSSWPTAGSAPILNPGLAPAPDTAQEYLERWADELAALQAIYDSDITCIAEGAVRIRVRPRPRDPSLQGDDQLVNKHTIVRWGGTRITDEKGSNARKKNGEVKLVEKDGAENGSANLGRGDTESVGLWLAVARTERYPDTQPLIEVQNQGAISHRAEDELFDSLLLAAASQLGSEVIYTLVELAVDFYTAYVEAAAARQLAAQLAQVSGVIAGIVGGKIDTKEGIDTAESWTEYRPSQFAGGVMEVLGSLPKEIGVLNVENVLRQDLAELFVEKREVLRKKHPNLASASDVIRMFHGTAMRNVPSIVRKGLVVPGQTSGVGVANGSTFGRGIYLSPDSSYSVPYCGSDDAREHRLLVCAALPGWPEKVTRDADQRLNGPRGTYDCRVSPNELEWIFFDAAQVLPCYVIHFHTERVRGFMYHDLSAAGALVKVQGDHPPAAAEFAARQAAKDEEALAGEMAARKRADFYFGKRFKVLDWSPPEDDDDADEQMVYRDAACSHLTEDGDEGEYTAEYQVARFDRQWGSCYAREIMKWDKKGAR